MNREFRIAILIAIGKSRMEANSFRGFVVKYGTYLYLEQLQLLDVFFNSNLERSSLTYQYIYTKHAWLVWSISFSNQDGEPWLSRMRMENFNPKKLGMFSVIALTILFSQVFTYTQWSKTFCQSLNTFKVELQ